jgi:hypothetical protein
VHSLTRLSVQPLEMLACDRAHVTLFEREAGQVEKPAAEPISVRGVMGDEPVGFERLQQAKHGRFVHADTCSQFVE